MTTLKFIQELAFTTLIIVLILDLAPVRRPGGKSPRYNPAVDCGKCSHYWHRYDTVHAVRTREEAEEITGKK